MTDAVVVEGKTASEVPTQDVTDAVVLEEETASVVPTQDLTDAIVVDPIIVEPVT